MAIIALAALTACVPVPAADPPPTVRPVPTAPAPTTRRLPTGLPDAAIASEVVIASNEARKREGLRALAASDGANRAAMEYAQELALRHSIDHTSEVTGKKTPGERLQSAGVKWTRVGENLAMFSPRVGIADNAIEGWLNSPAHRRNLLNGAFTVTGAGVARDERGNYYIVQLYATL